MKPCPHCGKELPQEMQFCPYCMEKLITETVIIDTSHHRHRRWWLWVLIFLLLLLLFVGSWWLLKQWRPSPAPNQEDAVASASRPTITTTTVVHTAPSTIIPATTTSTRQATNSTVTTTMATHSTASATHATAPSVSTSTSTGSSTAPCAAGHNWEDITQTVHVDEVGHYETKTVEKQVTLFRCAICYETHDNLTAYYSHFDAEHDGDTLQAILRDRYETVTEYRQVEEQTWVVDTPAYDKTITVGRRCRDCGKTETNKHKE